MSNDIFDFGTHLNSENSFTETKSDDLETIRAKHDMQKEKDLITKAFTTFRISIIALSIVFIISFFFDGNDTHVSEVIRILSTIATLALGFLFGANRKN